MTCREFDLAQPRITELYDGARQGAKYFTSQSFLHCGLTRFGSGRDGFIREKQTLKADGRRRGYRETLSFLSGTDTLMD